MRRQKPSPQIAGDLASGWRPKTQVPVHKVPAVTPVGEPGPERSDVGRLGMPAAFISSPKVGPKIIRSPINECCEEGADGVVEGVGLHHGRDPGARGPHGCAERHTRRRDCRSRSLETSPSSPATAHARGRDCSAESRSADGHSNRGGCQGRRIMMTVFTTAGRVAGFILNRGRYFEAFTADERPAGAFETTHRAATHLRELAEPVCASDGACS
jgi:hypothetical protein